KISRIAKRRRGRSGRAATWCPAKTRACSTTTQETDAAEHSGTLEVLAMTVLARFFTTRLFGESVIAIMFTAIGVFTFLAGVFYLPALSPTRMEMILALLLLAAVALLCHGVGQLAVVIERLDTLAAGRTKPSGAEDKPAS